ncbi:hypothetical protein [Streptomyces sp. NPDC002785]
MGSPVDDLDLRQEDASRLTRVLAQTDQLGAELRDLRPDLD